MAEQNRERTLEEMLRNLNESDKQKLFKDLKMSEKEVLAKIREEDQRKQGTWRKYTRTKGD